MNVVGESCSFLSKMVKYSFSHSEKNLYVFYTSTSTFNGVE